MLRKQLGHATATAKSGLRQRVRQAADWDEGVHRTGSEVDQYARLLVVSHAGRFELNETLVEYGWATAFRTYSEVYAADETRAKMEQ